MAPAIPRLWGPALATMATDFAMPKAWCARGLGRAGRAHAAFGRRVAAFGAEDHAPHPHDTPCRAKGPAPAVSALRRRRNARGVRLDLELHGQKGKGVT